MHCGFTPCDRGKKNGNIHGCECTVFVTHTLFSALNSSSVFVIFANAFLPAPPTSTLTLKHPLRMLFSGSRLSLSAKFLASLMLENPVYAPWQRVRTATQHGLHKVSLQSRKHAVNRPPSSLETILLVASPYLRFARIFECQENQRNVLASGGSQLG